MLSIGYSQPTGQPAGSGTPPTGGTLTGFGWNNFGNSTVILPQTNLNVYGDVYIESEGQIQNDGNIRLTNDWINHKPADGGTIPPPERKRNIAVGEQGTVLSRGETDIVFSESLSGKTANLRTIASHSPQVAYAAGDAGTVIKSMNAGETWESLSCGTMNDLQGMDFINDYTGIVVGKNAEIRTTNDSGITWTARTAPIDNTIALSDVMYADENTLYAVGEQGTIIKSIDGGATWEKLASPVTQILYAVKTHDVMTGYAVGESGIILYTSDGGANWTIQNSGTTETLRSICCAGEGELCVVGDNNTILRTSNAGTTWTTVSSGLTEPTRLNRIHFAEDEKTGYVAGDAGTLLQSKDAGMTWERQAVSSSKDLFDVAPRESRGGNLSGVGTVEFFEQNNQKIMGGKKTSFNNLAITKTAKDVTLKVPMQVLGILGLGGGILYTTETEVLVLSDNSSIITTSNSSFVSGPMIKLGDDPFTFILGNSSTGYHPLSISAPQSVSSFKANYFSSGQTLGGNLDATLESVSNCEYWTITQTSGTSEVKVTLGWNENSCQIPENKSLVIATWNGTKWVNQGKIDFSVNSSSGSVTVGPILISSAGTSIVIGKQIGGDVGYATLMKKLDGSYYIISEGDMRFQFDEEYQVTNNSLKYKIVNTTTNQVVLSNTPSLNVKYGNNRFNLNLCDYNIGNGAYILEVANQKGEKRFLRFVHNASYSCDH